MAAGDEDSNGDINIGGAGGMIFETDVAVGGEDSGVVRR